jgi:hypothetical protein
MASELQSATDTIPISADAVALAHIYSKGKAINLGVATIASGANVAADIITVGFVSMVIQARIGNATTPATAAADISYSLVPYEDDGTTLFPAGQALGMNARLALRGVSLGTNVAFKADLFDLGGVDKIRVFLVNNNVGALQGGTVIYYLQK